MREHHQVAKKLLGWVPILCGVLGLILPAAERVAVLLATRNEAVTEVKPTLGPLGWTGLALSGLGTLVLLFLAIIGRQDARVTVGALLVVAALILAMCLM